MSSVGAGMTVCFATLDTFVATSAAASIAVLTDETSPFILIHTLQPCLVRSIDSIEICPAFAAVSTAAKAAHTPSTSKSPTAFLLFNQITQLLYESF